MSNPEGKADIDISLKNLLLSQRRDCRDPSAFSRGWGELASRKSLLVSSRQRGRPSATWANLTEARFFSAQVSNPEYWAEQPETGSCLFCSSTDTAEEIKFSGFPCLHMGSLRISATHQAKKCGLFSYIHSFKIYSQSPLICNTRLSEPEVTHLCTK